jgi:hypothetical protein
VLYNQIAQRDAKVNLDIAKATRDDNVVMVQDSNAMKTISVLTTIFLLGTSIAVNFENTAPQNSSLILLVYYKHFNVQFCR